MQLRPRQQIFVDRCIKALEKERNTLGIAPTGAGKTIMLSYLIGYLVTSKNTTSITENVNL